MNLLPLEPMMEGWRLCTDCKHHEHISNSDKYGDVCNAPQLQELIEEFPSIGDLPAHKNSWIRCNETREFKFACGFASKWFQSKGTIT